MLYRNIGRQVIYISLFILTIVFETANTLLILISLCGIRNGLVSMNLDFNINKLITLYFSGWISVAHHAL